MSKDERLRQISSDNIDNAIADLESDGFRLFIIGKVHSSQEFFKQAKTAFPLDPAISGNIHWDAFADSLWGGLDACVESKIALIIRDLSEFKKTNQQDYKIALSCMTDAAKEVEAEKHIEGFNETEILVLIGMG